MVYLNFSRVEPLCRTRRLRLSAALAEDAVAIVGSTANVRWLTGLAGVPHTYYNRGVIQVLVASDSTCRVVAPASELGWICELYERADVHPYGRFTYRGDTSRVRPEPGGRSPVEAILDALATLPDVRTLVHDGQVPDDVLRGVLEARPDVTAIADPDVFFRARAVKDEYELDCLRRANLACEAAIVAALAGAREGVTERELLRVVRGVMVEYDAHPLLSALGFSERGALVDMPVSDRELRKGDLIRFDVGCTIEGYHADMSRTAAFGTVDPELSEIHDGLVAAEQAAIDQVRPGVRAGELFATAVETARASGVPDYDRTHCGHGIGLEIYEPPGVTSASTEVLVSGMTLCIETPYYLLGRAGLQIEDAVVVTDEGAVRLGDLPQTLLTAG